MSNRKLTYTHTHKKEKKRKIRLARKEVSEINRCKKNTPRVMTQAVSTGIAGHAQQERELARRVQELQRSHPLKAFNVVSTCII